MQIALPTSPPNLCPKVKAYRDRRGLFMSRGFAAQASIRFGD